MNRFLTILIAVLGLPVASGRQKLLDYSVSKPYPVIDSKAKFYFSDDAGQKMVSVKIDGKAVDLLVFDATAMKEISRKHDEDLPRDYELELIGNASTVLFAPRYQNPRSATECTGN